MARNRIHVLSGMLAAALALPVPARADERDNAAPPSISAESWRASAGLTFSTGNYGTGSTTQVTSAPVSLRYNRERFWVRLSVPFVRITGPGSLLDTSQSASGGSSIGDDGGAAESSDNEIDEVDDDCPVTDPSGSEDGGNGECQQPPATTAAVAAGSTARPRTRSGLGDASVLAGYGFDLGRFDTLDLSVKVKLPTASRARGLGTGKVDVTLGGTLAHNFGPATVWAGARRKLIGKTSAFKLRDTWGLGGGASYKVSPALTLGADYDWQQSATGRAPLSELTGWATAGLTPRLRLQAYAGSGLSSRGAKFIGGLTLSYRIGR